MNDPLSNFPEMPPVLKPKVERRLPRHVMNNVKERIPGLITNLSSINTQYATERQYVGEAISFLRLMQDMIE